MHCNILTSTGVGIFVALKPKVELQAAALDYSINNYSYNPYVKDAFINLTVRRRHVTSCYKD
jgi:hypothetical protein